MGDSTRNCTKLGDDENATTSNIVFGSVREKMKWFEAQATKNSPTTTTAAAAAVMNTPNKKKPPVSPLTLNSPELSGTAQNTKSKLAIKVKQIEFEDENDSSPGNRVGSLHASSSSSSSSPQLTTTMKTSRNQNEKLVEANAKLAALKAIYEQNALVHSSPRRNSSTLQNSQMTMQESIAKRAFDYATQFQNYETKKAAILAEEQSLADLEMEETLNTARIKELQLQVYMLRKSVQGGSGGGRNKATATRSFFKRKNKKYEDAVNKLRYEAIITYDKAAKQFHEFELQYKKEKAALESLLNENRELEANIGYSQTARSQLHTSLAFSFENALDEITKEEEDNDDDEPLPLEPVMAIIPPLTPYPLISSTPTEDKEEEEEPPEVSESILEKVLRAEEEEEDSSLNLNNESFVGPPPITTSLLNKLLLNSSDSM